MHIGAPLRRREDPALLTGAGRFLDDLRLPDVLHMAVVRSPHAHARVVHIATDAAAGMPGVAGVITAGDLPVPAPRIGVTPVFPGLDMVTHPLLAAQVVRYAGEPVAVIVAGDRYRAEDAAERLAVRYEPLPALTDPTAALALGAPVLHPRRTSNLVFSHTVGAGNPEQAFRKAAVVIEAAMTQPRLAAVPLECRAAAAAYDPAAERLDVWLSTQSPHGARERIAAALRLPPERVRVVAPDVGGGFGAKGAVYPEDVLVAFLALRLRRPVKWVEDRAENLKTMTHGRGQQARIRVAATADGVVTALDADVLADLGAYCLGATAAIPPRTALVGLGAYRIASTRYRVRGVVTSKAPTGPYRGAGRPEAAYYIERMMDLLARRLGIDPAEIRRRNFITRFPYTSAAGLVHDSGNYPALLDRALEASGYARWREDQRARRAAGGAPVGIGLCTWIEVAGGGELWESGAVRLEPDGRVTVLTGASPHGQGLATAFSQIAADTLGVPPDAIRVCHGDTAVIATGIGTFASRSLAIGGSAVASAAASLRDKIVAAAARLLEAAPADLVLADGAVGVRGAPGRGVTFAEIVRAAGPAAPAAREGDGAGAAGDGAMEVSLQFSLSAPTVPSGAHVAVVEVDPEIGTARLLSYTAVDDCGRVVNPLLVEGQVHGSLAQGVGQALFEEVVYDANGQLLTNSLLDYAVPTAADLPAFAAHRLETPSPLNPLGAKGIGESGTIGAPPAIVNAVADALGGSEPPDMPLTPERVWRAARRGP